MKRSGDDANERYTACARISPQSASAAVATLCDETLQTRAGHALAKDGMPLEPR